MLDGGSFRFLNPQGQDWLPATQEVAATLDVDLRTDRLTSATESGRHHLDLDGMFGPGRG